MIHALYFIIFLIIIWMYIKFMYIIHHQGPSGLKKSYKLQGNWQAIPKSLGRLDLNLTMLHLQVKVLKLNFFICWLDLIHGHIRNLVMNQDGNQQWKKNSILSKRMKHGNWFPFLPRGSLFNVSGYFKPKLLLMFHMWNKNKYYFLRATLKSMVCTTLKPLHRLQRWIQ